MGLNVSIKFELRGETGWEVGVSSPGTGGNDVRKQRLKRNPLKNTFPPRMRASQKVGKLGKKN